MLENVRLRVLKVFHRALGSKVVTALRIVSPAVETAIPMIIRVSIGQVLRNVVVLALEPVLTLQSLRPVTCHLVVGINVEHRV